MKRVQLRTLAPPIPDSHVERQRLYTVTLGNGRQVHFSSDRTARAFQAETGRWLSGMMLECNVLLADAYTAWRNAWPVLHATNAESKWAKDAGDTCTTLVRDAEKHLDRCHAHTGPNAAHHTWADLRGVAECLRTVGLRLATVHRKRSQYGEAARMGKLVRDCNALAEALRDYGTDGHAGVLVTPPIR